MDNSQQNFFSECFIFSFCYFFFLVILISTVFCNIQWGETGGEREEKKTKKLLYKCIPLNQGLFTDLEILFRTCGILYQGFIFFLFHLFVYFRFVSFCIPSLSFFPFLPSFIHNTVSIHLKVSDKEMSLFLFYSVKQYGSYFVKNLRGSLLVVVTLRIE